MDSGQTTFRLRHAWGELVSFGAGQYWSPFGDPDVYPNTLEYWGPTGIPWSPNAPSSPHAWRRRKVVCPESTPVPNSSNSKMVFSSPIAVGVDDLTPRRL